MKNSENKSVDKEREQIVDQIRQLISKFKSGHFIGSKNQIISLQKSLLDFRMKLAYNKGTESFESKFGWSSSFDSLNKELDFILNSFDGKNQISPPNQC
jgi:hypothetical protein